MLRQSERQSKRRRERSKGKERYDSGREKDMLSCLEMICELRGEFEVTQEKEREDEMLYFKVAKSDWGTISGVKDSPSSADTCGKVQCR